MAVPVLISLIFVCLSDFLYFLFFEKTNPWGTEHRLSFHEFAKEHFVEFDNYVCLFCFCFCETFNSSIFFTFLAKDVFVESVVSLLKFVGSVK